MRNLSILGFAVAFIVAAPGGSFGKSAEEAVGALRDLDVMCHAGISYSDYETAIEAAKSEVTQFVGSLEANKRLRLTISIERALRHYEWAMTVWQKKITGTRLIADALPLDDILAQLCIRVYPQVRKSCSEGGAFMTTEKSRKYLSIDRLVAHIWEEAENELRTATTLLEEYASLRS